MNNNAVDEMNRELLSFIDKSPNAYYAVKNLAELLDAHGYKRLYEGGPWGLYGGEGYYVTRDDSSIIAFRIPGQPNALSVGNSGADGTEKESVQISKSKWKKESHNNIEDNEFQIDHAYADYTGFQIMASHSDSPAFKIKPNAEITVENSYIKLNTEKYGGMIMSTWLDRPLSVAGRIAVRTENGVETKLVNIDKDLCMIPNLAIHMDRKTNDGYVWNAQKDMLPLFAQVNVGMDERIVGAYGNSNDDSENLTMDKLRKTVSESVAEDNKHDEITEKTDVNKLQSDKEEKLTEDKNRILLRIVADVAGVSPDDILDTDLFLYNRNKGTMYGAACEYIGSGRLDDLQCAFATMKGFIEAGGVSGMEHAGVLKGASAGNTSGYMMPAEAALSGECSVPVCCVFNNEEVGSSTKQGAASSFLEDVLSRINYCFGKNEEQIRQIYAGSFMVSADNAHALHPNHTDKADPTNRPILNKGIVIKYNANQKYTTDAVSGGIFRRICEMADVPVQTYVNRSDIVGGSTLGNIATTRVSINAVDIGLAQLAMHSAYETAGAFDTVYLIKAAKKFYSVSVKSIGDGSYVIE